jgi:Ca2+/Na+ antiporter
MEDTDVPANYVVRLRSEQAALRKSVLRIYHIQREEFLPSAYAMIVSFVVMIITLLMFTKIEGEVETLVTLAFLSFFFIYLIQLLNVINKPFKVGQDRRDDDVSLFLLYEFVVHARTAGQNLDSDQVVAIAELVEEQETQVTSFDLPDDAAVDVTAELQDTIDEATAEVVEKDPA